MLLTINIYKYIIILHNDFFLWHQRTLRVATIGAPNAGKSTLNNALVGAQVCTHNATYRHSSLRPHDLFPIPCLPS